MGQFKKNYEKKNRTMNNVKTASNKIQNLKELQTLLLLNCLELKSQAKSAM